MEFIKELLTEFASNSGDASEVPYKSIEAIRKLIKKGAMDPDQHWSNALQLVHVAYQTEGVERPKPSMKAAWGQYEDMLLYTVQQLQKATEKGVRKDDWKLLSTKLEDEMGGKKYNV